MKPYHKYTLMLYALILAMGAAVYIAVSWAAFQWRNPLSNEMSFYRNFIDVVTWQRVPGYQP